MNVLAVCELAANQVKGTQSPVIQFRPQERSKQTMSCEASALKVVSSNDENQMLMNYQDVPAVIKVIAAGGGGANALNRMIDAKLTGVNFIAVNTDIQDLYNKSKADIKIQIGTKITGGWGAGGNPEIGEKAAIEDQNLIADALDDAHMVFITAGMGGGTGTGSAPVIAKIAKDLGALTVAVVTTPFEFEADFRMKQAEEGIAKLREVVDTLIIIPNQHLFKIVDNKTTFDKAYHLADEVLCRAVQGISELITKTGFKNTDFADAKTIMKDKGDALMGIGYGTGDNRAMDAVKNAVDNPLLEDTSINGATGVLINIAGPEDITLVEIQSIIKSIKEKCDSKVNLIHGIRIDPEMESGIQVTVIATGFRQTQINVKQTRIEKIENSNIVDLNEYGMMLDRKKGPDYLNYLPQREYHDDLDVPSIIRKHHYQLEEKSALDLAEKY